MWVLSSVPGVAALPVCYSNAFGYHSCGYATWGISLAILMLIFLFMGLFCYSSRHYSDREEAEIARTNMAYVAHHRNYMATTYAPSYDTEAPPAVSQTNTGPRPRPSSLTAFTTYDKSNEPQYPATAYPFTGYSVVPPPSRDLSKVHHPVKTKDATT